MLHPQALLSLEALPGNDIQGLVDCARQFQRSPIQATPLRGRILALLSDDHDSPAAQAFLRAATGLGAQVARVRATEPGPRQLRDRARLLGQLYDAIECQGLDEADLRQLGRDAGVPVFNGIASPDHPLQTLAARMTLQELRGELTLPPAPIDPLPAEAVARNHHHLLQAVLSCTLA
ncbi:ornithine carbamoyltransferase [Pelomonas saccharophila]|uniref:Ornithine carbamoyltransferase n=1 Tax=Roseateles saccharophilus TaxID=304 RepID=A0ABU1YXB2_ROSSA|nr:hypothetical protein [Roseateles saccharophilus]MDR7272666.1 ornithine carbamoyltransferase [Roseateles saccharophilus]